MRPWVSGRRVCGATCLGATLTQRPLCVAADVRYVSAAASAAPSPAASQASGSSTPGRQRQMMYRSRWRYAAPWREKSIVDFVEVRGGDRAVAVAHTYRREADDTTVTLIPLRHFAHPFFFAQVDGLCCQHESVLMEGRVPLTGAPFSTMVPARQRTTQVRPPDHEDDEGWEPRAVEAFFQPFSWGVADSPNFTVVHAADKYDYERLPWWCAVRFSAPVLGSLGREKHCLDMVDPLRANGYKTFAVPWGAAHMPVFHEMLLDNAFEPIGMSSLLMLSRIDGDISDGEVGKLVRWQRRHQRRPTLLAALGALVVAFAAWRSVRVQYGSGGDDSTSAVSP